MTDSTAAGTAGKALPPELRALVVLVLLDLLTGVWLGLHTKGVLSVFLAPQIPAVGAGALFWGFLPDEPKAAFGRWLAWRLGQRGVFWTAVSLGGAGLIATGFLSTVVVDSVDPGISTPLHVLRGTWRRPDTAGAAVLRLNRLTSPQYHRLAIWPTGSPVWLHTATHITARDRAVRPWIPLRLQYPDDFEPMVTVAVLPVDKVRPKLSRGDTRLRVTAEDSSVLADTALSESAFLLGYAERSGPDEQARARWRAWLLAVNPDTAEFVNPLLEFWSGTRWIPATRPLRLGERLAWEVRGAAGGVLASGTLDLDDVVTDLHLVF